jgi:hypothetical protein
MSSAAMFRVDINAGTESVPRLVEVAWSFAPFELLVNDSPLHRSLRLGGGIGGESQ